MSALEDRTLDKLADMIYNTSLQDLLEVWRAIRPKMDSEGAEAVKAAFEGAKNRFLAGPFESHIEVRWGMSQCVHCNDDNIEKNGIAYVQSSGDGLEFNTCLNCNVGILYNLVFAKATLDSYLVPLGKPGQFNGMSFYWSAIFPAEMDKFQPVYEVVNQGQWVGSISFDESLTPRYLPFDSMTESISRGADEPWASDLPEDVKAAVDTFITEAKPQIEVSLALR